MKLLIADDELLTREGLASSIDWESMGIHQIFQADDGLRALHIAKLQEPDIILSDIRMPRMNGIELVERLTDVGQNNIRLVQLRDMQGAQPVVCLKDLVDPQVFPVNRGREPLPCQQFVIRN